MFFKSRKSQFFVFLSLVICLLVASCTPVTPAPVTSTTMFLQDLEFVQSQLIIQRESFAFSPSGNYGFFADSKGNHYGIHDGKISYWRSVVPGGFENHKVTVSDQGLVSGIINRGDGYYGFWESEAQEPKYIWLDPTTVLFSAASNDDTTLYNWLPNILWRLPHATDQEWQFFPGEAHAYSLGENGEYAIEVGIALDEGGDTTQVFAYNNDSILYEGAEYTRAPQWRGNTLYMLRLTPDYGDEIHVVSNGKYLASVCETMIGVSHYLVLDWNDQTVSGKILLQNEIGIWECNVTNDNSTIQQLEALPGAELVGRSGNLLVTIDRQNDSIYQVWDLSEN